MMRGIETAYTSWKEDSFIDQYRVTEAAQAVETAKQKMGGLTSLEALNQGLVGIIQLIAVYVREVREYNDRHKDRPIKPDPAITQFSKEFQDFFAQHPIAKAEDSGKISLFPEMRPFDPRIPALDKDGKPYAISLATAVQYCTYHALQLQPCQDDIDAALKAGKPLEANTQVTALVESFLVLSGVMPETGDNQHIGQAVQATILGHMLKQSRELFLTEIRQVVSAEAADRNFILAAHNPRLTALGVFPTGVATSVTFSQLQRGAGKIRSRSPQI